MIFFPFIHLLELELVGESVLLSSLSGILYNLGKTRNVVAVLDHDEERKKSFLLPNCVTAVTMKNTPFTMTQHVNFLELPREVEM